MSSHQQVRRVVCLALLVFFLSPLAVKTVLAAPPPRIILQETKWRTGELEISYTHAVPGNLIILYAADYRDPDNYKLVDMWVATAAEGTHIVQFIENGQTVWYYVQQMNPLTNETSPQSNLLKQTPPITAYIINWPDMFKDLDDMLNNALEKAFKPSQEAQDGLKDALDGLKDAIGGNSAANAGGALQDGLNQGQSGMKPPIVHDDGIGTYTGGQTGGQLPQQPTTGSSGLEYPDPDSGTSNDFTIRIPYGVDMQGNLLYVKLFTKEQMDKMKWLDVIRQLAAASEWIGFVVWLVQRFTPQLKA